MFRKLVFPIWILFGIWVLVFGILVPYPEKKIASAESAGADVNVTLWLAHNNSEHKRIMESTYYHFTRL